MKFQVTQIEFDFDGAWDFVSDDYASTDEFKKHKDLHKKELTEETISQIWEADDAEHLVDKISDETGWCIKSIDYTVFIPGVYS
jgi:hypothetical protein